MGMFRGHVACLITFFWVFDEFFSFFLCFMVFCLFWLVHPEAGEVLEDNVVFFLVGVERVLIAMALNGLHLLHGVEALAFNSA